VWCWCAVVLSVSLTSNTASNLKDFFLNIYPKCIISSIHAIGLTNFKGMHVRAANLCAKMLTIRPLAFSLLYMLTMPSEVITV